MKIIAISGRSVDYKSATGLEKRRLYVNGYFSDVAEGAGFILFPVCSQNGIEEIATMCSGLIIAGRDRDIHPKYYGEEPDPRVNYPEDDYEDELDFKLIEEFVKLNKPILGVCSGLQSLNVYFGGTLKQHIENHTSDDSLIKHNIIISYPRSLTSKVRGLKNRNVLYFAELYPQYSISWCEESTRNTVRCCIDGLQYVL